ncbi:CehA/McbA family metallohydrolase [Kitasatospora sp. CB01950]|uniref:CehA/McbA family metallohydrolase n=1 Tax=Kitasatospora sp. CB01950 TaxID=1703930 RepID=UPI0009F93E39|nr:CehA/McbA family metallohydrolase [Kitasatospora sp. CB01950]
MGDWYRGDCHVHSVHSDGRLTPAELAAAARAAGLDFLAVTEHNCPAPPGVWAELGGEDLLILLGQEVTTRTGHWLALGLRPGQLVDWRHRVGDPAFDRALREVRAAGGLCVAAHPHAPYPGGDLMFPLEAFDAVEVWNGEWTSDRPWNADNHAAHAEWGRRLAAGVRAGRPQPALGNSDAHLPGQLGTPQTVVHAEQLDAPAILAALRAGRSWIAESAAVELEFTAEADGRRAGIGERLATGGRPVALHLDLAGVPDPQVRVHTERGKARWQAGLTADAAGTSFVRVEVRHPDGRPAALTNPILLE